MPSSTAGETPAATTVGHLAEPKIVCIKPMNSLSANDQWPPIKLSSPETKQFWELTVLYEDEQLLALEKPVELPVSPNLEVPGAVSLMRLLHGAIAAGKPWAVARKLSFLMNTHRLDPEATGVLLLAKSKPVLERILDLFGSQRATVSYIVLVSGEPREDRFKVAGKLSAHPSKPGLVRIDSRSGKRSETAFEVLERFDGWTLVKGVCSTNRPHQARVHLARLGLRVVGDGAYGGKPLWLSQLKRDFRLKPNHTERPLIGRPCLHAAQVETKHPATEANLVVESPLPKDLQVALKYLRKYAPASGFSSDQPLQD